MLSKLAGKSRSPSMVRTEHDEQVALFLAVKYYASRWPELKLLFAVPNAGKRSWQTGKKFKAEGLKPGVPDICLPVARGGNHGLFIELKRVKGGSVSDTQAEWICALQAQGYRACVCKGADAALAVILEYMRGGQ